MKPEIKKRLIRRLKILEGQVRGLQRMVSAEEYCVDILRQSSAAKEAISSVEDLLLENHLTTHVVAQVRRGEAGKVVRQVLTVYRLAKRR